MSVSEMEHVLVLSDDIEATREFYCDIVGLRVGERPRLAFGGYWLYAGDTACLRIAERQPYLTHAASLGLPISREPPGTGSIDHVAFNADDYGGVRRRLATSGGGSVPNNIPPPDCASCSSRIPTGYGSRST